MRHPMSLNARRELIQSIALRYHQASKADKKGILDELVAPTPTHASLRRQHLDCPGHPGGGYLYRLTAGAFTETKAMTLLK